MIGSSIVSSPEDGLAKLAKHARAVLVLLAAVQLIGGAILYVAGALAIWANEDPLSAVLVGLGIWIAVIGIEAIIEPSTLFNGLILKAIVIVMFVNPLCQAV